MGGSTAALAAPTIAYETVQHETTARYRAIAGLAPPIRSARERTPRTCHQGGAVQYGEGEGRSAALHRPCSGVRAPRTPHASLKSTCCWQGRRACTHCQCVNWMGCRDGQTTCQVRRRRARNAETDEWVHCVRECRAVSSSRHTAVALEMSASMHLLMSGGCFVSGGFVLPGTRSTLGLVGLVCVERQRAPLAGGIRSVLTHFGSGIGLYRSPCVDNTFCWGHSRQVYELRVDPDMQTATKYDDRPGPTCCAGKTYLDRLLCSEILVPVSKLLTVRCRLSLPRNKR